MLHPCWHGCWVWGEGFNYIPIIKAMMKNPWLSLPSGHWFLPLSSYFPYPFVSLFPSYFASIHFHPTYILVHYVPPYALYFFLFCLYLHSSLPFSCSFFFHSTFSISSSLSSYKFSYSLTFSFTSSFLHSPFYIRSFSSPLVHSPLLFSYLVVLLWRFHLLFLWTSNTHYLLPSSSSSHPFPDSHQSFFSSFIFPRFPYLSKTQHTVCTALFYLSTSLHMIWV